MRAITTRLTLLGPILAMFACIAIACYGISLICYPAAFIVGGTVTAVLFAYMDSRR